MAASYLQLPSAWGGVKYGPFKGSFSVGSDSKRCVLVLEPHLGIHPVHVTLHPEGPKTYRLEPGHPEAGVFLKRRDEEQMFPVRGTTQATCGDTLVLGTPSGPPFTLHNDVIDAPSASTSQASSNAWAGQMGREMQRQGMARVLAKPGPLRDVYHMWTRARTGSFSNPRFVIAAVLGLMTALAMGTTSCTGLGYVLYQNLTQ